MTNRMDALTAALRGRSRSDQPAHFPMYEGTELGGGYTGFGRGYSNGLGGGYSNGFGGGYTNGLGGGIVNKLYGLQEGLPDGWRNGDAGQVVPVGAGVDEEDVQVEVGVEEKDLAPQDTTITTGADYSADNSLFKLLINSHSFNLLIRISYMWLFLTIKVILFCFSFY